MAIWIMKVTWMEDDAEVSEQWEVNAPTVHDAVREATTHIRFQPHHVEARHRTSRVPEGNEQFVSALKKILRSR